MSHLRKTIACIFALLMLVSATSCSTFGRAGQLSGQVQQEHERIDIFKEAFFKALESKDHDAMEGLFSSRALKRTDDLDESIDYVFDLCGGKKVTVGTSSSSSTQHIEKNKNIWELHAYCYFTVDNQEYKVFWVEFMKFDEDKQMLGVYMINVTEKSDEKSDPLYTCAGLYTPSRSKYNAAILTLDKLYLTDHKATDQKPAYNIPDESTWSDLWDPSVFATLAQEDKDAFAKFFVDERSRDIYEGWYEIEDDGTTIYYARVRHALKKGVLGIRYNSDGLITGITIDLEHTTLKDVPEGIQGFEDT
ncbi:MAG: DUF5104 domain-containing protein [Clostridiales bacterium]|nr:DUF5104 domain-containing protein [Clostridiales bacterium]